jgi:hypothetical protein
MIPKARKSKIKVSADSVPLKGLFLIDSVCYVEEQNGPKPLSLLSFYKTLMRKESHDLITPGKAHFLKPPLQGLSFNINF